MIKKIVPALRNVFSLDYRSLAAFRIGMAILIILDLCVRGTDITAHYTDDGVVPRALGMSLCGDYWFFSFHYICGNFWFQTALFLLAGFFALLLMVGYRTRLMTVLSWLFLVSIQNRNFLVLNGGDVLFRLAIFWGIFLPWGAKYSIDRALETDPSKFPKEKTHFSGATIAYMIQLIFVYHFSGQLKAQDLSWRDGTAIYYAGMAEVFSTVWGRALAQYRDLLSAVTPMALLFELWGGFLILVPWKNYIFRLIAIAIFWGFHITNAILFEVGFFSPVGFVVWITMIPSIAWDKLVKPWPTIKLYFDDECSVCKKMVKIVQQFLAIPDESVAPAQGVASIHREMVEKDSFVVVAGGKHYYEFEGVLKLLEGRLPGAAVAKVLGLPPFRWAGNKLYRAFADHRPQIAEHFPEYHKRRLVYGQSRFTDVFSMGVILLAFAWNLASLTPPIVKIPQFFTTVGFGLRINQGWSMFVSPYIQDGWFVVPGTLKDGSHVDLFKGNGDGGPLDWQRPEIFSATFPTDRWRKYMLSLYIDHKDDHLREYGRFLCRKWNGAHSDGQLLETFQVIYMKAATLPTGGKKPPEKQLLWTHHCF